MKFEARRTAAAAAVSLIGLAALFMVADVETLKTSRINWQLAGLAVAAFVGCVLGRGLVFRQLAPRPLRAPLPRWLRLAARHQMIFSLAPSGLGDIIFPTLARRLAEVEAPDAVRMIAQFRIRDLVLLTAFAAVSGLGIYGLKGLAALALTAGVAALYLVEDVVRLALRLVRKLAPHAGVASFLEKAEGAKAPPLARVGRTGLAVIPWVFSVAALSFAFEAAGHPLGVAQVMLVLVGINVVGLVAVSVAGFGVAEGGMAGVLILLGLAPEAAAATALVVRPLLLAAMVAASLLLDSVFSLAGIFRAGARR